MLAAPRMDTLNYMAKKGESLPMELRETIAVNLKHFMGVVEDPELKKNKTLGLRAGVGRRTIDRLLNPREYPEHAPTLKILVAVSDALHIEPGDLLIKRKRPMLQGINHHREEGVAIPKKAR